MGPIPYCNYYEPDTVAPSKCIEFFKWYNKQFDNKGIDFKSVLQAHYHNGLLLFQISMERFCGMFMNLTDNEGRN